MRAVVFSGTTEGRMFSKQLAALGAEVLVSVATPLGQEEQGSTPGVTVRCGRLLPDEMAALLGDAALCIDATHPYATSITESICTACRETETEYLRLLRQSSEQTEDVVCVENAAAAAAFLESTRGNILLTTGSKELAAYSGIPDFTQRVYARVLPMDASLEACRAAGLKAAHIIAMQGPFSYALNRALMEQFAIRFLVTKDGGAAGGFEEKARAAQDTGAQLMVIRRPAEQGETAEQILTHCKEMLQ